MTSAKPNNSDRGQFPSHVVVSIGSTKVRVPGLTAHCL